MVLNEYNSDLKRLKTSDAINLFFRIGLIIEKNDKKTRGS